jgi:hypothetical protein
MSQRRVLLGVASGGHPTEPFLAGLRGLKLPAGVAALQRSVAVGNYVPAQRELIMSDAIDEMFDYLLFVDDDIALPERALEFLLQTAESDPRIGVVGGLYYSRDSVRPVTVADWNSSDTSSAHIPAFSSTDAVAVDGIGFGCALLRVAVARELQPPYFPAHIYIERSARRARLCDEDYLYCERVRQAGYTVQLDGRVRCPHFDRDSKTSAPLAWEDDRVTSVPRMIVQENGAMKLVPFDAAVPRVNEHHTAAELTYLTVD